MALPKTVKSDNPLDLAIEKNKRDLAGLQIKVQSLMATFANLPPKERARAFQEVVNALTAIQRFIEQSKAAQITNAGSRFGLENLKSSYSTLAMRWKKFERTLGSSEN